MSGAGSERRFSGSSLAFPGVCFIPPRSMTNPEKIDKINR
jgi:hypothetical protein